MAITIKDIAELCKVSKGTVSRVINDEPGVGEETRKRILKLIKELDYQPNASARGLAVRRSNNIGVVIPHTGNYSMSSAYWPTLLTAITEKAAANDYNILLSTARSEDDVDSAYRSILRGKRVDGLVISAEQLGEKQLIELMFKDFPFVMVGKGPDIPHYYVDVDNVGGSRKMTEYLIELGHKKIAMLTGPEHYPSVKERVEGFKQAMDAAGLEPKDIYYCPYWTEKAAQICKTIIHEASGITAIYAAAGDLVAGVLKVVKEEKIRIPDDLALVSFDDHPLYEYFVPGITAVSQPINLLGEVAAEQLFLLMEGKVPDEKGIILPTEIIVRGSCGTL